MNPILTAIDQFMLDLFTQVLNVFIFALPEILTIFVGLVGLGIVIRFIITMIGGNPAQQPSFRSQLRNRGGYYGESEDYDNGHR
jgi:hypothetical protein